MKKFIGDWAFLSNFDPTPFYMAHFGHKVKSGEHAFSALKTLDLSQQAEVLSAGSPAEAKSRGRRVKLRPDWDTGGRVVAMQMILEAKFVGEYAERLLATGTVELVEYNCWHDQFWGDCTCGSCVLPGVNMLGELLMARRATLARNI